MRCVTGHGPLEANGRPAAVTASAKVVSVLGPLRGAAVSSSPVTTTPTLDPPTEPDVPTVTKAEGETARADGWGPWLVPVWLLVGGAVLAGVFLRFVTRSPLWLDESLSVNIARLPVSQIPDALRHDGHPPLYYVLLHGWMSLFGYGNVAVRAFSGLWSLAVFPLLFLAARRAGGTRVATFAIALYALSPYGVRYGTETRMYSMVMVLALGTWLLVDDALRRPVLWRLAAVAGLVGALLWTHYWAMWFLLCSGLALLVRAFRSHRAGNRPRTVTCLKVAGAIVGGGVLFLPWVPALIYQGVHTGTPWAKPIRPTLMTTNTLADLGGGSQAEAIILGWVVAGLAVLGLFGRALDRHHIELDLRTRPAARPFAVLIVGTLLVACGVGYATGATYATRYAAVFVPFLFVLAGLGMAQIRSRPMVVVLLAGLLAFGAWGSVKNAWTDRTDARRSAQAITERAKPGDLVVYCPDQLGPSTSRLLRVEGVSQVTYPAFKRPERVDWVDYIKRLDRTRPGAFVSEVLRRVGEHRVFYVFNTGYTTHRQSCDRIFRALARQRPPKRVSRPTGAFEPSTVTEFAPGIPVPPTAP